MFRYMRNRFLAGLLILLPAVVTGWFRQEVVVSSKKQHAISQGRRRK